MRCAALLSLALLGACVAPRDPFAVGERSLLSQDLPAALVAFDAVPVSHLRYPEARATALGVERRMRRGHELLLEALLLRAEWRDKDALLVLRRAHAIWPHMPGVHSLITATEHRAQLLGEQRKENVDDEPIIVPTMPRNVVAAVRPDAGAEVATPPPVMAAPPSKPAVETAVPIDADPVSLGLVAVETRLGCGDLEAAVVDLIELSKRFPADSRVGRRLSRVLHQRALQRYGHGQLSAAIVDWERVVELDSDNALAKTLLAAARAEAGAVEPRR